MKPELIPDVFSSLNTHITTYIRQNRQHYSYCFSSFKEYEDWIKGEVYIALSGLNDASSTDYLFKQIKTVVNRNLKRLQSRLKTECSIDDTCKALYE